MSHFSEHEHPYYKDNKEKWKYADDHYTGRYAELERLGGEITHYLHQKYQRENNKAFEERKEITDPVLHFATIVDGINGVMASKESETMREWGAFGDPEDDTTDAYQLLHNADASGTNWIPLMKKVGIKLTVKHDIWGYVEGVTDTDPHIQVIDPENVINWYPSKGDLEQVLVKEKRDIRSSIFQDVESDSDVYTLFDIDGWRRFTVEDGNEIVLDSGEYVYWKDNTRQKRILPIFRTQIPMPRNVGYLLSIKENHIYNAKSVRDFALRNLSFAILQLFVESEGQYNDILQSLEKGFNVIPNYSENRSHEFMSPDSSYLAEFEQVLKEDVEQFYINGFKKYAEAASQVTATAVKLENQSGIESFLALLVSSVDEFEQQCFLRLEQVYFDSPSRWGEAKVKRSRDFQPKDTLSLLDLARAAVELERSGSMSLERRVKMLSPDLTEEEIEEEIQRISQERGLVIPDA